VAMDAQHHVLTLLLLERDDPISVGHCTKPATIHLGVPCRSATLSICFK
jgi:hypothetical protein